MPGRVLPALLAGTLLLAGAGSAGASAPTRLQQAYTRAVAAEAYSYVLQVRTALMVAFLDNGQRPLSLTRCEDDYRAEVRFSGGPAFVVDQDGVRPLDPASSAPKGGK